MIDPSMIVYDKYKEKKESDLRRTCLTIGCGNIVMDNWKNVGCRKYYFHQSYIILEYWGVMEQN